MGTKTLNYTADQTAALVEAYQAATDDESRKAVVIQFADELGKSAASVRQKLVREGVYVKPEYKTKTGKRPESKAAIVADIARTLGTTQETIESLEKATKPVLELLRGTLKRIAQNDS